MVNTVFTLVSVTVCLWSSHITRFLALGALEILLFFSPTDQLPTPTPTGALGRTCWATDAPSPGPGRHVWLCHLDDSGSTPAGEAWGL